MSQHWSYNDKQFALVVLQLLTRAATPQPASYCVHLGEPVPKARARVTRRGTFTPKRTVKSECDLAWALQMLIPQRPLVGPLALVAMFYRSDQRICDSENLLKLVMDAGTRGRIWHDDSQIVACAALVDIDVNNPRTVIALAPAVSGLRRAATRKTG